MKLLVFSATSIVLTLLVFSCKSDKKITPHIAGDKSTGYPVLENGSLEANTEAFWELVPGNAKIEILAEGHDWTEGPLWVKDLNILLYTDIPKNEVYKWKEGEGATSYLKPSGFLGSGFTGDEPGANGLLLDKNGSLILCQHGERRMARMTSPVSDPKPEYELLAARYEGKRFNSPNDAVYKSNGDLYFTDPPYGLPGQMEDPEKEIDFQGVYRLGNDGTVTLLTKELSRPNGIAFSPDERTLYLANSDPDNAIWKAFDLTPEGLLSHGRTLYDATSMVASDPGLPDGMAVDAAGNLFATGPGGVWVFSPDGKLLGRILTKQATSNCTFNTDGSVLYMTADEYLLRIRLQ